MDISKLSTNTTLRFQKSIPQHTKKRGEVSKKFGSALSIPGFGTFSNRQTYIIDPSKNVRWIFVDVESHIPRHSTEVLEKLKELQRV